jgi:hypothetical protein
MAKHSLNYERVSTLRMEERPTTVASVVYADARHLRAVAEFIERLANVPLVQRGAG